MLRNRLLGLCGCVIWIVGQTAILNGEERNEGPLDTTYVMGDSTIVIVAYPQRVFARESKLDTFRDDMLSMLEQQSGIDARNVRQIVIQFGTDREGDDRPARFEVDEAASVVFRFDKPVTPEKLIAKEFENSTKASYKRTEYYRSASSHQPAVWFPDNRTMIVANEWRVLKMIDEPNSMGLMVSRLRQADSSADLFLELDVRGSQTMLQQMFQHLPAEEPFAPDATIEKLTRVTLTARLLSDTPLQARLVANSARSAEQLKAKCEALLGLARGAWLKQRDKVREQAPQPQKVAVDSMIETVDAVLEGMKLSIDDQQVVVRVDKKGGSVDLITMVLGSLVVSQEQVNAVEVEVREKKVEEVIERERALRKKVEAEEAARRARQDRERAADKN